MIDRHKLICIIPVFLLIMADLGTLSWAEEPAIAMGIRTLGMGGASIAAVNDEDLFFSNPAALSYIENPVFSSFDLRAGFSHDSISYLSRLSRYINDDNLAGLSESRVNKLNAMDPLFKLSGPLNVTYIRRYFGVGLFETLDLKFDSIYYGIHINGPYAGRTSAVRISGQQTVFGMVSFADDMELPPRSSRVSIGGTLKYVIRAEVKRQDVNAMWDDGVTAKIGRGFGFDIGVLYKIRGPYAVGLMIRDALSSRLVWANRLEAGSIEREESPQKTKIRPRFSMGASFAPDWELPYVMRDFVLAVDIDRMRSLEIGAEVTIYHFLRLRTGVSNDGIALGLGLKWDLLAFDYAFVSGFRDIYAGKIDNPSHFWSLALRF